MRKTPGLVAAAGVLVMLWVPTVLRAQVPLSPSRVASLAPGTIQGFVLDEHGAPIAGAVVSALGSNSAYAVTDHLGRFELRALPPGPYLVRAHLAGYLTSQGQIVRVLPSTRSSSAISLRRVATAVASTTPPVVQASIGLPASDPDTPKTDDTTSSGRSAGSSSGNSSDPNDMAWRLSHARRSILKDVDQAIVASNASPSGSGFATWAVGHAFESSARLASNFFTDTPFSGQVNILTTSSFDTPQDLFAAR